MFQFTTTTVINSNVDYTTGMPLFTGQKAEGDKPANMNVKRHLKFIKDNVVSITKAGYTPSKVAKATLNLGALAEEMKPEQIEGNFRIAMYIKLAQSSANSYYANDLVFKGKPFYIEFIWKKGEKAAAVAKKIKDIVKKYMLTVYEKELVKVSVEDKSVVITGTDEYQRFVKVDIEKYVKGEVPMFGQYEVVKSALPTTMATIKDADGQEVANPEYDDNFEIEQGVEGFGTYQWILKNLRLPTAARTSWTAINADEVPIIGAKYNEYIIRYCVNRGIMGGDAVGEVTKSLTTHVFYVNQDVVEEFETALEYINPKEELEVVPAKPDEGDEGDGGSIIEP